MYEVILYGASDGKQMKETLSFIFKNQIKVKNTDKDLLQVWGEEFLNAYTKPNYYFFIRNLESIKSIQFSEIIQNMSKIPDSNVLIQVH